MYLNSLLLLLVYNKGKESTKLIKYLESDYASNVTFKEHLDRLCQKDAIASGILQNYCLHIQALVADSFMLANMYKKAS